MGKEFDENRTSITTSLIHFSGVRVEAKKEIISSADVTTAALDLIKKILKRFEWKTDNSKSDVMLVIDALDTSRQKLPSRGNEPLSKIDEMLKSIIEQSYVYLNDPTLTDFEANLVFSKTQNPSVNSVIAKIDTYTYGLNGDMHIFMQ